MTIPDPALVERVARAMWNDGNAPLPWRKLTKGERADFCKMAACAITETFAALRESGRLVEWRPIAEAPKDGTWILGWAERDSSPYRVSWGRNHRDALAWCTTFSSFIGGYITHWQPLEPPPATVATEPLPEDVEETARRLAETNVYGYDGVMQAIARLVLADRRRAVEAERSECMAACSGELLEDATGDPEDDAYNRAVCDCIDAIRARGAAQEG